MQPLHPLRIIAPRLRAALSKTSIVLGLAALGMSAASAVTPAVKLQPQNATLHCSSNHPCTQPTVDGYAPAFEYADGREFPLQDYSHGGPNGILHLMVTDAPAFSSAVCNFGPPGSPSINWVQTNPCLSSTLFIGLKIPRARDAQGHLLDASGQVVVWLDAKRADTLKGAVGASQPQLEDRKLILVYNTAANGAATLSQFVGNGAGWTAPGTVFGYWPASSKVAVPGSDPDNVHIEIAVTLRPSLSSISEPLDTHLLGLGLKVLPNRAANGATVGGGTLPNDKNAPPVDASTLSWLTLDLSSPTPIPLSFAMWNVGQMPYTASNGGSGNATSIAQQIFKKETACLSEVWTSSERQDIADKVNALRAAQNLPPMNVVDEGNDEVLHPAVSYTGLLFLTSREILLSGIHHFPHSLCTGADCFQAKGAIWARLALPTAHGVPGKPSSAGVPTPSTGLDGGEFADVFCSHVNAGSNQAGQDTSARHYQFLDLRAYIDQVRKGGPLTGNDFPYLLVDGDLRPEGTWPRGEDRPAVLLGDMNTPGPRGAANTMGPYLDTQQYTDMMHDLRIDQATQFDKTNSLFSDARDLGKSVAGPDPSASGTWLGNVCKPSVSSELNAKDRIDFLFVLPPADLNQLPAFALLKNPIASVDPHFDPGSSVPDCPTCATVHQQCLSDHAELDVSLALTRVKDTLKFNAMKPHRVEFSVSHVKDLASGGCCADWYTPMVLLTASGVGTQFAMYLDHDLYEGDEVSPNWSVSTGSAALPHLPANFQGTISATAQVWDYDSGSPNDHYDSIPQGGNNASDDDLDVHLTFFAATGDLLRVVGASNWTLPVAPNGFIGNFNNAGQDGFYLITTGSRASPDDNATVTTYFRVIEL